MARVPEIIRRNPISQVAAKPAPRAGQGFSALADLAKMGEDFVRPAAHEEARERGSNSVYRDENGRLSVNERSVLGGELAEVQNSAAYAKYMGQQRIDMSETFTELGRQYQFDPAGFKEASDAYISTLTGGDVPSVLRDEIEMSAKTEAQRRFNGLYNAEINRTYSEANRNTATSRDMLVDDYIDAYTGGDMEAAEELMAEIEAISTFRSDAPYINETDVETSAYLEGVRGAAKAASLTRELETLEGATSITEEKRSEILDILNDPDISSAVRNRLYTATHSRLKGIDAAAFVARITDPSFEGVINRENMATNPTIDLSLFAEGGATREDSFSGMNSDFRGALEAMFASAPAHIREGLRVFSGYRSPELQEKLWNDALAKYGSVEEARKWVAPPGNSQHNHGHAADLRFASDEVRQWIHDNAGEFGLSFPLSNENWHIELATAREGGVTHDHAHDELSREANAAGFEAVGVPVTPANEYMAMTFGIGESVKMITGDPSTLVADIMPPEFMEQNPIFSNMTAAEARSFVERKVTTKASDLALMQTQIDLIPDPEVRAMATTALAAQIRTMERAEAAAAVPYVERLAAEDDTLTSQEIQEDHSLSDSMQSRLVSQLSTQNEELVAVQQTVMDLNDPSVSWDPYDSKQRNSVDDAYKASLEGGDPLSDPVAMTSAIEIADRTGFAPQTMFNAIRAATLSGDPARVAAAMEVGAQIIDRQPNAFGPYGGRVAVMAAMSDYRFYSEFNDAETAAQRIVDMNDPENEPPKNLTDRAKDVVKDLTISDIQGHFDDMWFSAPTLGNLREQDVMMDEYGRLVSDAFIATGDVELAKNRALDEMGRIYGVNAISGSDRVMKFPPQNFYPMIDGSQDWMKEQLETEISKLVFGDEVQIPQGGVMASVGEGILAAAGDLNYITASNIKLVSDPTTRAQIMSGQPPSYKVYYMQDGVLNPVLQRYAFDPSQYQAGVAESQQRERDAFLQSQTTARGQYYDNVQQYGQEEAERMIREEEGVSNAVPR